METGDGRQKIPKRQYRIVSMEKSDVFFINVAKFFYFFTDSELKKMKAHIVSIDKEDIREKVTVNFKTKKINQEALLNAMNVNLVHSHENPDQRRHLTVGQSQIQKLDHWLSRVKKNESCIKELNDESAKIKVLNVEQNS